MMKIRGDGIAVSIRAVALGNARTERLRPSTQARADFEVAWRVFLSNRTEVDFQACRDQEAWTAEKYRRFDRHERMPSDWKPPRRAAGG